LLRYLPATLKAKEGNMIKTIKNNSLISNSKVGVSFVSGPPAVKTIKIPIIPKMIDENIKTFVAIFCMV
jgi:hypothetical protein